MVVGICRGESTFWSGEKNILFFASTKQNQRFFWWKHFFGGECWYFFHGQRCFALYQFFLPWRRTWCIQCLWIKMIKSRIFLSSLFLCLSIPFLFFEKKKTNPQQLRRGRLLVQAGLWLAPMLAGLATQLFNVRTKHGEGALPPWHSDG